MKTYYIKNTQLTTEAKSISQACAKFKKQGLNGVKGKDIKRLRRPAKV